MFKMCKYWKTGRYNQNTSFNYIKTRMSFPQYCNMKN